MGSDPTKDAERRRYWEAQCDPAGHLLDDAELRIIVGSKGKIAAIKAIRQSAGFDLKHAKIYIDEFMAANPDVVTAKASCFPADCQILTPTGCMRIADIEPGDWVLSHSSQSGLEPAQVTHRVTHPPNPILVLSFHGRARPLRTTGHHTLLTESGWRRACEISVGDMVYGVEESGGSHTYILSAINIVPAEPVYNLHTTGPHNLVADFIVAHNFTTIRRLRTLFHRIFIDGWTEKKLLLPNKYLAAENEILRGKLQGRRNRRN